MAFSSPPFVSFARIAFRAPMALWLLTLTSCGGESTPTPESAHAAKAKSEPEKSVASESSGEADEAEAESAPRASCDDGTCFECGSGTCPEGWYCDESAQGGPACSWLPECGKKPSCACIGKALGGACTCNESGGGQHVKCK